MCVLSHDHVQCVLPCMYMYEAKIEQCFKYTDRPTQARSCDGDMFQHAFRDLSALETECFWFSVMIIRQCVLPYMYMYEAKIKQYCRCTDRPTQARSCDGAMFKHAFRDLSTVKTQKCVF